MACRTPVRIGSDVFHRDDEQASTWDGINKSKWWIGKIAGTYDCVYAWRWVFLFIWHCWQFVAFEFYFLLNIQASTWFREATTYDYIVSFELFMNVQVSECLLEQPLMIRICHFEFIWLFAYRNGSESNHSRLYFGIGIHLWIFMHRNDPESNHLWLYLSVEFIYEYPSGSESNHFLVIFIISQSYTFLREREKNRHDDMFIMNQIDEM